METTVYLEGGGPKTPPALERSPCLLKKGERKEHTGVAKTPNQGFKQSRKFRSGKAGLVSLPGGVGKMR